ncbi:putative urea ABC transporter substrate-binding protein [Halomonas sp. McH1-25]|uniref:putative urea ABC transporter substrate-binding protein n=1 Tax=unclassified Halomonas TaxID=2609666 RepID=UPI001EF65180|nr:MULTISPECIES: putative urea ABC transporter substrate-binding protein [unclassified Halomonas]MCG7599227.1 putative urea ABC transporter substrate-binding protein [Halomonas sp. McH1-25]MCP1341095.1 putative urea ABC transporter substrate-binding protein [Halomonas sp. FL8]MCP1361685.1 putative urea ABC transporter substrate-binding protein [Halomonas sp. BBD45]MCP1365350.1 putative urea ABC transporter substrate-binding protein [Halomonas sp. BBD48]
MTRSSLTALPARLVLTTAISATLLTGMLATSNASAQEKDQFNVCWSIYAGWMPWSYADTQGIVDKWADKYDIEIDVVQVNDYVESINQYTSGNVDGCAMTNMDALTLPAASGVDSTALIINDYSNGNDGVVLKGSDDLAEIEGRKVNLVQFSVSHYFLARALETVGLTERDIQTVNTSDADMVAIYPNDDIEAVVTWNPQLSAIDELNDSNVVFTSRNLPAEILDMMVVNTDTLAANPDFGRALVGAWYEVMDEIEADNQEALSQMAEAAGTDLAGYKNQLAATYLYTDPQEAAELMHSEGLLSTMQRVAEFSYKHGLLGEMAPSAEFIGIETPQGVFGDENNIQLRFDPTYTETYIESQQ